MHKIVLVNGENIVTCAGELSHLTPYVNWPNWAGTVDLDGEFTAAELRAIADHMESESA